MKVRGRVWKVKSGIGASCSRGKFVLDAMNETEIRHVMTKDSPKETTKTPITYTTWTPSNLLLELSPAVSSQGIFHTPYKDVVAKSLPRESRQSSDRTGHGSRPYQTFALHE